MNKIWGSLGLAVLGIAILVGAAGAADDKVATLTGNPTPAFEISSYPAGTTLTLTPGTTPATYSANLVVNANTGWTVKATADTAPGHTQGYMSKYTAGETNAYASTGPDLINPMKISSPYVTTAASLATSSGVTIETGTESETDSITFTQLVDWGDEVLSGTGVSYRMVVTFTIA